MPGSRTAQNRSTSGAIQANNTAPHRRYASIPAAAEYADCSTKTIRRRISGGELTGYRFGSRVLRVDLNDVDRLMRIVPSADLDESALPRRREVA